MVRHAVSGSRCLAGALALALALVSSAACLVAVSQLPDAQGHACCAAMEGDCGSATAVQLDCCTAQSPPLGSVALTTIVRLLAPPAIVASPPLMPEPTASRFPSAPGDAGVLQPPGVPLYLLDSVFRI